MPTRQIHLRIYPDRAASVTSRGWAAIGWPPRVEPLWDDRRGIGLRVATPTAGVKRLGTKIKLGLFLRIHPAPVGVRILGYAEGDTLWFPIPTSSEQEDA